MATALITTTIVNPITASFDPINAMASKRVPLASVPNAVNSPYRSHGINTSTTTGKRTRAQDDVKDVVYDQPPAKRLLLGRRSNEENVDPDNRITAEEQHFLKRPANAQPTQLERKLAAAARERKQPAAVLDQRTQQQRTAESGIDRKSVV